MTTTGSTPSVEPAPRASASPQRSRSLVAIPLLLLAIYCVATILARPLLPLDETRYTAVAWEMWTGGDFLSPHLNGAIYAQKPPLLFWLMTLGWKLFGVSEAWPRLIPFFAGAGCLLLTSRIAKLLWPNDDNAGLSALVLFCIPIWTVFATMTNFDMLLSFFALLAHAGILLFLRENDNTGLLAVAAGIGGGILAKGPVILLHTVPVVALARVWLRDATPLRKRFLLLAGAAAIGVLSALAWAVPAAIAGGSAYTDQIFRSQTTGRILHPVTHKHPWWWYFEFLPLFALPWLFAPALWRGRSAFDAGFRYCAIWLVAALVLFSAIGGKQIYYLLPEIPAIALLIAWRLQHRSPLKLQPAAAPCVAVAVAFLALPFLLPLFRKAPSWLANVSPIFGALILCFAFPALLPSRTAESFGVRLALLTAAVLTFATVAIFPASGSRYDLRDVSRQIASWQAAGRPLSVVGGYHGQFHFLGRLRRPLVNLAGWSEAMAWAQQHPTGLIVNVSSHRRAVPPHQLAWSQEYRGGYMEVWDSATILAHRAEFPAAP